MSKRAQSSSITNNIPDVDKIFEEGREPTEEEWILWAQHFKPKKLPTKIKRISHETLRQKTRAKQTLNDKERKRKAYKKRDEVDYKSWGKKYNMKRAYLAKYNKAWADNAKETRERTAYRKRMAKYDSWVNSYKMYYNTRLSEIAHTYKISEDKYVYGFTLTQLRQMNPYSLPIFNKLLNENIIPLPVYEAYRFKDDKISKKLEKFYLLEEAKVFFNTFKTHKVKLGNIDTDEKRLFLKKKLWEGMLNARKEFDGN